MLPYTTKNQILVAGTTLANVAANTAFTNVNGIGILNPDGKKTVAAYDKTIPNSIMIGINNAGVKQRTEVLHYSQIVSANKQVYVPSTAQVDKIGDHNAGKSYSTNRGIHTLKITNTVSNYNNNGEINNTKTYIYDASKLTGNGNILNQVLYDIYKQIKADNNSFVTVAAFDDTTALDTNAKIETFISTNNSANVAGNASNYKTFQLKITAKELPKEKTIGLNHKYKALRNSLFVTSFNGATLTKVTPGVIKISMGAGYDIRELEQKILFYNNPYPISETIGDTIKGDFLTNTSLNYDVITLTYEKNDSNGTNDFKTKHTIYLVAPTTVNTQFTNPDNFITPLNHFLNKNGIKNI